MLRAKFFWRGRRGPLPPLNAPMLITRVQLSNLTTGVSCPTALGALCGQLTFRLAWCREHSAVMATELLQPPNLACGTFFQSSCVIPTSPTDCSDDS